jgi:hypothetical protein
MSNLEPPKENKTDRLYNLIKGGIGTIPYAGSIAAETFGLIVAAPISKRREKWMNIVGEKIIELEKQNEVIRNFGNITWACPYALGLTE